MAYLIFSANGEEFDRRELRSGMVIGRALDCDVCIHDILLSRHHCGIERTEAGWQISDLGSKNGTLLSTHPVARHLLRDGDRFRIGRTQMTYFAGPFATAPPGTRRRTVIRPADPKEAMAGTITGFTLVDPQDV